MACLSEQPFTFVLLSHIFLLVPPCPPSTLSSYWACGARAQVRKPHLLVTASNRLLLFSHSLLWLSVTPTANEIIGMHDLIAIELRDTVKRGWMVEGNLDLTYLLSCTHPISHSCGIFRASPGHFFLLPLPHFKWYFHPLLFCHTSPPSIYLCNPKYVFSFALRRGKNI